MNQIVECIPNFSDGRRPDVYNAIAQVIASVPGTEVLDVSADADHNRTVITFVGSPDAVEEAAFQAIQKAADLIDLNGHEGEHPRIGATDVCPFVPVQGVTMADCVAIAHRLGERVGRDLGIAVYFYAEAAKRPERVKLGAIRRGEYETWKEEVGHKPEREPDFGPAEPKPWGATVIGARPFLLAYNIYLNTDDVDTANKIARAVRHSSGGLRFVQAMGFLVEGQAQVSMNLTNYEKTPIFRVQELVRREAARYGLLVTKAELIGLAPQKALQESARWYLQIDDLQDEQILETRLLEMAMGDDITPIDFLEATASGKPTPGGGSTSALAGALAAALTQMVSNLTVGRKKYAEVEDEAAKIAQRAGQLRGELAAAISEDAGAFDKLMAAWRDKSLSSDERTAAIEKATIHAGEVPLKVARLSREVSGLALQIAKIGNANAVTDAATGGLMARAAVQAAGLNVKINGTGLKDQELAASWTEEIEQLSAEAESLATTMLAVAAERGGF